ncbi:NUDIX domain-containing protein [Hazenella sp. IB182357]|uniref:NUDIX domain-containing protein n=1 Tax=Polycladospora coralii TaxID=2771432 RepID=A0A926NFY3_9BACL|nr:NUDIX domain-containing protein [Polycladospora coralii]MBD1372834.1 NUDIX domain-containing protein [Polycladospora coralii]
MRSLMIEEDRSKSVHLEIIPSVLIFNPSGQVLLRKDAYGDWDLPSGICKGNETLTKTLLIEVYEQTGLVIEDARFIQTTLHKRVGLESYIISAVYVASQVKGLRSKGPNLKYVDVDKLPPHISAIIKTYLKETFFPPRRS